MAIVYRVSLPSIREIKSDELETSRLQTLLHGYSSFDQVLNSKSDPITLDGSGSPPFGKNLFDIIDGQHRIYLARQKGYTHVPATIRSSEKKVNLYLTVLAAQKTQEYAQARNFKVNESELRAVANSVVANEGFKKHVHYDVQIKAPNLSDLPAHIRAQVPSDQWKHMTTIVVGCHISNEAKKDLSLLGIGMFGSCY